VVLAVAYLRVSKDEENPENQRLYLERWAGERGYEIVGWYVDVDVSGDVPIEERPAFSKMVEEVQKMDPRPQVLLVYETSRLVRSFQELFRLLDLVENKLGMVVVSASEREQVLQNVDGLYRQFLRAVFAFVAQMELEFIRQRTRAALERAKREGKVKNVLDKLGDEAAEAVVETYRRTGSLYATAKETGLSLYAVRRILAAKGLYALPPRTCPRCFSKMRVVDRTVKDGKVVERLRCPNCGYEAVRA